MAVQQVKNAAVLHVETDREDRVLEQRAIRLERLPLGQIREQRTDGLQTAARRGAKGCVLQRVDRQLGVGALLHP